MTGGTGGGSRHTSRRDRKKAQVYISDWEQEQLVKQAEVQGIAQADLLRDALRSVLGYVVPSEDWDYAEEWKLLWAVRLEMEKIMTYLALETKADTPTDELIASKVRRMKEILAELANLKIKHKADKTRQPR